MANIKSAKKRISVNARQRKENRFFKATVNTYTKKFRKLIAENNLVEAEKVLTETISLIDSAASKGVFHKNNASRKVSRLTSALHKAKVASGVVEEKANTEKPVEVVAPVEAKEAEKVEAEKPDKKATAAKTTAAKKTTTAKKAEDKEETKKAPAKKATTTAKKTTTTAKKTTTTKAAAEKKTTTAKKPATKKAE